MAATIVIHHDDSAMEMIDSVNNALAEHGLVFEVVDDGVTDPVTFELKKV